MKYRKPSPKRATDHRQGCKPLQKTAVMSALKGRQNALPPLRGLAAPGLFTGVSSLPGRLVLTIVFFAPPSGLFNRTVRKRLSGTAKLSYKNK